MALEELRTELEAQHQASVNQMRSAWSKERETEIQLQVKAQVAVAKAAWKEEQLKVRVVLSVEALLMSVDFSWCSTSFFCFCPDGEDLGTKTGGGEEGKTRRDR